MGLIQALDLILFAYIDSLVAWTPEEFMANFRKDTYIPDRLTFAFEAASAYINEYKQEAAVIAVSYGLIIGGSLVLPSNAAIGSGMINAGISVGMKGLSDYWEHGKITYSAMEYTKTGMAGFASGTITGGIAKYGISIGLSGIKNSVFASFGGMSGFAAAQLIMTGNVDPKEMIVSGIISFVCAGGIRDLAKIATPKSVTVPVSKVKGFFADEKGELSSGKPGASGFDDGVGAGTKGAGDAANAAQGAKLKEFYTQAEKYGTGSTKELENGRYRFYGDIKPASTEGEMAGARLVREWDPLSGAKRTWYETVDNTGNIRQVRPDPSVTNGMKTHYMFDANGNYTGSWIPQK